MTLRELINKLNALASEDYHRLDMPVAIEGFNEAWEDDPEPVKDVVVADALWLDCVPDFTSIPKVVVLRNYDDEDLAAYENKV